MITLINADILNFIDNAIAQTEAYVMKSEKQHYAGFVPSVIKNHIEFNRKVTEMNADYLNRVIPTQDTSITVFENIVIGEPIVSIMAYQPTQAEIDAFRGVKSKKSSKKSKIIKIA